MVKPITTELLQSFKSAGADCITIHPESTLHLDAKIKEIKKFGVKVGLAFTPTSSLEVLDYTLDSIDHVLIMSVNPGFGGQVFIPSSLEKIRKVREMINKKGVGDKVIIMVDGGVSEVNVGEIINAGADQVVVGSALFKEPRGEVEYKKRVEGLWRGINDVKA